MFQKIFDDGNKVFTKNLVLRFIESPDDEYRMAFIIRKKVGNAVVRNRIRRIIRETVFKHSESFDKNFWVLFNVKDQTKNITSDTLREDVLLALKKAGVIKK